MGVLDLDGIIDSLDHIIEITGVSITATPIDSLGNKVSASFDHTDSNSVNNWTISWGDNSGTDHSGIEIVNAATHNSAIHTLPVLERSPLLPHDLRHDRREAGVPASITIGLPVNTTWAPSGAQDKYNAFREAARVHTPLC
jgi:hypothetical protein